MLIAKQALQALTLTPPHKEKYSLQQYRATVAQHTTVETSDRVLLLRTPHPPLLKHASFFAIVSADQRNMNNLSLGESQHAPRQNGNGGF
ncbi:hypothetical protein D6C88_03523, partial [Aureobasidium pullulans]